MLLEGEGKERKGISSSLKVWPVNEYTYRHLKPNFSYLTERKAVCFNNQGD